MNHDDRLIVALDFPTMEQAKAVVLELGDNVSHYKVGMELYYCLLYTSPSPRDTR